MSHDVPRILLALLLTTASVCGDVLSQWNFNSPTPDANSATGSSEPSMGSGIALAIGGATTSFAAATSETPDPATSDNTAWNIANFPRIMEGNLTAGVQFNVSTRGYESIVISWGEMHSASASRYVRPQYTLDGIHYINLPSCTVLQAGQWTNFVASLAHVPGAVDNPDFGFRIVAEQEITAISNGYYTAYMPSSTNSTYAETGIIRLDMFTVSGQPISDGNTPPVLISAIGTQSLRGFQSTAPLAFTVLDAEEPATSIVLQKSSSNPAVMPLENITLTGTGATRTVTLRGADVSGSSDVRITAIDGGGKSSFFTINVTVVPQNSSPVLTVPRLMYSTAGLAPCVGSITVQDEETAGALLSFEIRGEGWLPDSALAVTASGTNRTIQITPPAAQAGIVRLHAEASDGTNSTSAVFPFMLLPFEGLYVYEPFNYPDGSAVTNSGFYWQTRSGLEREAQTTNGWLRLSEKSTEDLTAPLAGGPVTTNEGNVVYASFKIRCTSLPDIMPDYFFHLQSGSSLIGRVFWERPMRWKGSTGFM